MKKLTLTALVAFAIAISANAGERMVHSSKGPYQPVVEPCFGDREFQIDLFGAYGFTQSNQEQILGDHAWGGGLGLNYFFTRNVGVGAEGTVFDTRRGSDAVGYGALNLFVRFPIDDICLAPYLYGGVGGVFNAESLDTRDLPGREDSDEDSFWAGHIGAGVEYRFMRNVGIFVDGRYTFVDKDQNDFATVRSGIRIAF